MSSHEILKSRVELLANFPSNQSSGLIIPQKTRELVEATSPYHFNMGMNATGGHYDVGTLAPGERFDITKSVIDDPQCTQNYWSMTGFKSDVTDNVHLGEWTVDGEGLALVSAKASAWGTTADGTPTDLNYRSMLFHVVAIKPSFPDAGVISQTAITAKGFDDNWANAYMYWADSTITFIRPGTKLRVALINHSGASDDMTQIRLYNFHLGVTVIPNYRDADAYAPYKGASWGQTGTVPVEE